MDAKYKVLIRIGYASADVKFKEFEQAAEFVKYIIEGTDEDNIYAEIRLIREEAHEDE